MHILHFVFLFFVGFQFLEMIHRNLKCGKCTRILLDMCDANIFSQTVKVKTFKGGPRIQNTEYGPVDSSWFLRKVIFGI